MSNTQDATRAPEIPEELRRKFPQTDLHCHLDGSVRVDTILELAEKNKVELPAGDAEGLRKIVVVGDDCENLADYLRAFDVTLSVMQDTDSLSRIAYELVQDCAAENVRGNLVS